MDKLQEKLVSFLELNTHLAQEKLKEHLGVSGVTAGLFAAVGQDALPSSYVQHELQDDCCFISTLNLTTLCLVPYLET